MHKIVFFAYYFDDDGKNLKRKYIHEYTFDKTKDLYGIFEEINIKLKKRFRDFNGKWIYTASNIMAEVGIVQTPDGEQNLNVIAEIGGDLSTDLRMSIHQMFN